MPLMHSARQFTLLRKRCSQARPAHQPWISLWCRSKHVTGLTDINDAIEVQTQALDLTPDNHTDKPGHIENLAVTLHSRFELLGEVKDLDYAITLKQQAVNLTADAQRGKPSRLGNLSASFLRRFERLGELADLEQAITVQQQVVYLTPQGHADLPSRLDHLSSYLLRRYERLWELSDLQQAIVVQQRAVKLTPKGHTDKASRLNHLGIALQLRYERLGKLADGKNAILAKQQAVGLLANNNKLKPSLLQSLGNAFQSRFDDLHKLADVNHAIDFQQQAVGLTPEKDTHRSNRLHSLGNGFQSRFELLANLSDIDEAISLKQQAVELMPDGHADKPSKHYSLGSAYRSRFKSSSDSSDLDSALSAFQNACSAIAGDPSVQLDAAIDWANLCSDPQSALPAYEQIFQLIPMVVWLGQTIGHRYTELTRIGRMVNSAVAAAIAVGDFPKAVEWLEEGRGVVWGDILQLRSPLDELDTQYPHLAKRLKQVSRELETAGRSSRSKKFEKSKSRTTLTGEQEAQKHTKLADEYQKLITEIREKDGFGSFLRPKKLSELLPAADNGPIVIVNVAKASCDALILPSSSSSIIHVPLPTFSVEQGQKLHSKLLSSLTAMHVRMGRNGLRMKPKMAQNSVANDSGGTKDFQSVLAELWTHVVQPILSQLGLTEPSDNPEDRLPQITWCTTGALAFHPLHAAGIYGSRDPRENVKTSDFVISSYTPTLTALINSASKIKPIEKPSVLIISQPATKDLDPLPGTQKEAEEIELCVSSDYTKHLTDDQATITAVTSELGKHEIVHLACHGIQDSKDPLGSSFALHDGGLNLQALMGLSLDNVRLAVLSACQTATGDKKLPEEAVHLAAGMLAVGYPSVIATMWSIGDEDAPRVARSVYASLFDKQEGENMRGLDSAYALHEAVEHLREEVGEMNFVKWVPFVHFGI
ncbi:CHAT domain-containing protein [Rhodocollybia butyracea]|uniref:CHAT domain-containing protein n=1 Tax=Rhodocollybia butyracea TaxID=206335 RepID=A0A9P5PVW2_9AGAR|nr:CHAT domain-containing protein [Rhodocollybia butyracea]